MAKVRRPSVQEIEDFVRSYGPEGCPKTRFDFEYRDVPEMDRAALLALSGKIVKVRGLVKGLPANIYKLTKEEDRLPSPSLPVTKMFDGPTHVASVKKDQRFNTPLRKTDGQ